MPSIAIKEEKKIEKKNTKLDELELAIVEYVKNEYYDAFRNMESYHTRWDRYEQLYNAEYEPEGEDENLKKISVPQIAKAIDTLIPYVIDLIIPDKYTMDFFDLQAKYPIKFNIKQCIEKLCQKDLRSANIVKIIDRYLRDLMKFGNGILLPIPDLNSYVSKEKFLFYKQDQNGQIIENEDGINYFYDKKYKYSNGKTIFKLISPYNFFPLDLTAESVQDTDVILYFPTSYQELKQNKDIYQNLDKLTYEKAGQVSEKAQLENYQMNTELKTFTVKGFAKYVRMGRFELEDEIFEKKQISESTRKKFYEKFKIDKECENNNNWIIEIANDVLIRVVACDYPYDERPIIHQTLLEKSNRLIGEGLYFRSEHNDRIYNFYLRRGIQATDRIVRPPWFLDKALLDNKARELYQDQLPMLPDAIIDIKPGGGAALNTILQPVNFPPNALAAIMQGMNMHESIIEKQTSAVPSLQAEVQGGTATETAMVQQSAIMFVSYIAEDKLKTGVMADIIRFLIKNRKNYMIEKEWIEDLALWIHPEMIIGEYDILVTGAKAEQNKAVQSMKFVDFIKTWAPFGKVNTDEGMRIHAEMIDIPNPDRIISQEGGNYPAGMGQNMPAGSSPETGPPDMTRPLKQIQGGLSKFNVGQGARWQV